MLKKKTKITFIFSALLLITVIATVIFEAPKNKPLNINQCSASINERSVNENISAKYQRVITIVAGRGFARDTGVLSEGENSWRLNRFYTFSLKPISRYKYELMVMSHQKADDDNAPDITLKRFRPEQGRKMNITSIEEIEPDVWLFSGLAFPLFACKELKPD
ncbi:hypothetical protein [Enterobacter bugandensis]|uniref:hypothetical protein n=1 Tax=Enterobacter bugandensis TaxID=881260 RepID=UPI0021D046F6|nr:hypothetical protein [Enterobacter bugandensis]MCU6172053.1 hypothetical protein [Enterobacter bugandensis]